MANDQTENDLPNPSGVRKAPYEKPSFRRIGADEAETGISNGPEILILLS